MTRGEKPERPMGRRSSRQRFTEYRRTRKGLDASQSVDPVDTTRAMGGSRRTRQRSFWSLIVAFFGMLKGSGGLLAMALGSLSVATLLGLAAPAATKIAIDYIILDTPGPEGIPESLGLPTDRMALLWLLSGSLVGLTVISVTVGMWGRWQATKLTKMLQIRLRRRVFDRSVRLPLHRVQSLKSGGVASMLREDAGGVAELIFSLVYNPWRAVVQVVMTMVILAITDWRLLLGAMLLIPTVWLTHRAWIERLRPLWRDIRNSRSHIDAHATEAFAGMRVVRAFAREAGESGRFLTGNAYMARQEIHSWWWSRMIEIVWALLIPLASSAVLLYGGWQVIRGQLTIGDLMMFTTYLLMLLGPIEALVMSATNIQNQLAGLDRVLDLLEEPTETDRHQSGDRPLDPREVRGEITLEGVSFAYPGSKEAVIRDVSFVASPGQVTALVGASGSGKSTLCNLVARFYAPTEGRVLLDGEDLATVELASYRRLLGIVEQDVLLFDGTVFENIAYARRGATREQVIAAAEGANASAFIERFDHGYATLIGERGVRLSGGQKQRIAIARAMLADPNILILDEATSNLDAESESLIQQSLRRMMRGRTSFVIAHRLSTIMGADQILVIEEGRIVERGTHRSLLEAGGRYAQLLRLQLRPDDVEIPGEAR